MPTRYYVAISIVLFLYTMVFLFKGFIIIPNQKVGILEKLGAFKKVLYPGIHFIFPFRDHVKLLSLKDVMIVKQDIIITEEEIYNVNISIHYKVEDIKKFAYSKAPDQIITRIKQNLTDMIALIDAKDILNQVLLGSHERWGMTIENVEVTTLEKH